MEYTERVKKLTEAMAKSSSKEIFAIVENEINTKITALYNENVVYGEQMHKCRIKIENMVLCTRYNVLKANYAYLVFAVRIIKEKLKYEKIACLYKKVAQAAIEGLTAKELEGVIAVIERTDGDNCIVIIRNISEETGITRSVILNGLRKLECAGLIEIISKGAKGSQIRFVYGDIRKMIAGKGGN